MINKIRISFNDIWLKEPDETKIHTLSNGSYTFLNGSYTDWKNTDLLPTIIEFILAQKFVETNYHATSGYKREKISTTHEIVDFVRAKNEYLLIFYANQKDENSSLTIGLQEDHFSFSIHIDMAQNTNKITVDDIKRYVWNVINQFKEIAVFGLSVEVGLLGQFDFPRIRPPRIYGLLGEYELINVFDHTFFNLMHDHHLLTKDTVDKFTAALTKTKVFEIEKRDNFSMITWVDSLEDDAILEAFSIREDFIFKTFDLPVETLFNNLGDKQVYNISQLKKIGNEDPFWSYYDEERRYAFKLVVLDKNKQIDSETVETIKKYAANPKLKNDDEITKLLLILPDRKYLELIDKHAKSIGIYKLFYLDDKLNIWDVNPVGNWKN